MDKNRLWMIGSVLIIVLVLVGGTVLGIQPQLALRASADAQRVSVEASNDGQTAVLAALKKEYESIDDLKAHLKQLRASVPSGTQMPALVHQLDTLSAANGVTLDGITVADAIPYAPVVAPVAAEAVAAEEDGESTPAPEPTAPAVLPGAGVPPVTSPLITAANFSSLAVSVNVSGSYANVLNFVSGLQSGERLFLVSGLTTSREEADEENVDASAEVIATISGLVYVLMDAAAPAEPAAPAA